MTGNTTNNSATITISYPSAPIINIYPGQLKPQPTFVQLDPEDGTLLVDWSGEIGNAIPSTVYHNLVLRWDLPYAPTMDAARALLDSIAPLAEQVRAGWRSEWDGRNMVGKLDEDAAAADQQIQAIIREQFNEFAEEWNGAQWAEATEYFAEDEAMLRARLAAGETVDDLVTEYDGDGESSAQPVLIGLRRYLDWLANDVPDEDNED